MKEQTYIIKNIESFEPKHIFECGQCFRWNLQEDGSYTGIVGNNVLNVKKQNAEIIIIGYCEKDIKEICNEYFDLHTDYKLIKETLSKKDDLIKESIKYGEGIRVLNQNIWETLISFIISANNNIPRIKGIIEKISKKYGKKIIWRDKEYYTFPTPEQLSKASISDLRNLGVGFRDVRIFETTRLVKNNIINLKQLKQIKQTDILREQLLKFPGVGPKVADCIMLFSMQKLEVFPIDVWVKRVMTELYKEKINNGNEKKGIINPNNKEILKFAEKTFGEFAGLAQQYLFYWRREL